MNHTKIPNSLFVKPSHLRATAVSVISLRVASLLTHQENFNFNSTCTSK